MIPTINQYLLDLLSKSQIAAAEKTGDSKKIALAKKNYEGLTESEVTFGKFVRDDKTGKYSVKIVAKSRNWTIEKMTFNTGTIEALSRQNQQGAAQISALEMVTAPGLIYVQENDSRYLAIQQDSNLYEALKLTGYEFPADSFVPTVYGEAKKDSKAVGQVDIDHPIVAGRFLLYYFNAPKSSVQDDSKVKTQSQETDLKMKGGTNVSSDNAQNNDQQNGQENGQQNDQQNTQVNSQNSVADSNEGDQANPGSTQHELKTPAEPGQSDNGPEGQSNSADATSDPAETAKENEETAKENEAGFKSKQEQNKVK
jgi:hypothetical protein